MTETGQPITVDSPAWFDWLLTATHFCYSTNHPLYRFTARKENRRHHSYWYGYLKMDGKLHNAYLGKAEQLTLARLEEAGEQLIQKSRQKRSIKEASAGTPTVDGDVV